MKKELPTSSQGPALQIKRELISVTSVMTQTVADQANPQSCRWHAYTGDTSFPQFYAGLKLPPVDINNNFEDAVVQLLRKGHISATVESIYPDPSHYYH